MAASGDHRAQDVFKGWLDAEIAPFMKEHGFARAGLSFTKRKPDVTAVVAFQKHPTSSVDRVTFWLNAGVWSPRLADVMDRLTGARQARPPSVHGCQWRIAFSDMMRTESSLDIFWSVRRDADEAQLAELGAVVRERLRSLAIPKVVDMASEPALRDALLSGYGQFDLAAKNALVQALTDAPGRGAT